MGQLYAYRDKTPRIADTAVLFDSAEITGDVVVGDGTIIGAGVKIIGDSHGPVRIGARVQILENSVLHLLPDNELVVEDDVVIGPGAMIHGCHLGAGTVVEPAAIVCDSSRVGAGSVVRAGACVKQRAQFAERVVLGRARSRRAEPAAARPTTASYGDLRVPGCTDHRPRNAQRDTVRARRLRDRCARPRSAVRTSDHHVRGRRPARIAAGIGCAAERARRAVAADRSFDGRARGPHRGCRSARCACRRHRRLPCATQATVEQRPPARPARPG